MSEILAVGLQAMQADAARLEHVAMNLANVLTPGYRRHVALQAPIAASFGAQMANAAAAAPDPSAAAVAPVRLQLDLRAGTLRQTGRALDLALAGPGYFEVRTADGVAYTRNGSLRIDAAGRLVTQQGLPVLGEGGEVRLPADDPVVTATGAVLASGASQGAPLAQLRLVEFDPAVGLQPAGDGLFTPEAGALARTAGHAQVRQGWLENANVAPAAEMIQLVRTLRHFEAMQKVMQGHDELLGTAIRKLGEAS